MKVLSSTMRENIREEKFCSIWQNELQGVFVNIAPYYDVANYIASFGLWGWFRRSFMKTIEVHPHDRILDVCAGTNAIGIALLAHELTLEIHAIDYSMAMQEVGKRHAESREFQIKSVIADVHTLPFPDNHFDGVTLQFASRHLRVRQVFSEIYRVLKPGGSFYHCDMLRPTNRIVVAIYYGYLRFMLWFTAFVFRRQIDYNCKKYFIDTLQAFYSIAELSHVLNELGYTHVKEKGIFFNMLGMHRAVKPSIAVDNVPCSTSL